MGMNDFTKDELELIHKLEKLHQYLHGAHSASSEAEASGTFHQAAHTVQEILGWIKEL